MNVRLKHDSYKDGRMVISAHEVYFDKDGVSEEFDIAEELLWLVIKELKGFSVYSSEKKTVNTLKTPIIAKVKAKVKKGVKEDASGTNN